jgi:hypothetical protein
MEHGAEARARIRKDVSAGSITTRLANDRKLRKKVRAMLEDLESAGDRVRRRKCHRLRNGLLVLGGVGAVAVAAIPNVRRWISDVATGDSRSADEVGMTV